jgi:2-amino-4-hydroxy-6-hydroxymethyldihydropteridine diphosphokinase
MKSSGEVAYVALGSNLGDREAVFSEVVRAIRRESTLELCGASPVFETDPVGPGQQGPYLNAAVRLRTMLTPFELLDWLQGLELSLGRDRSTRAERWGPRVVDLDILFYGDRCIETSRLVVPHPRAHERAFVLIPMAALAPEHMHPVLGATMQALAAELTEPGSVRVWRHVPGWPEAG